MRNRFCRESPNPVKLTLRKEKDMFVRFKAEFEANNLKPADVISSLVIVVYC